MVKYMDNKILISFIIPTLNEEKILEQMLQSLHAFKKYSYEIIVSDGGSTDGTLAIAHRLADKVIENTSGARQTIAIGRNSGAAAAVGEFLVFIDADVFVLDPDNFFASALGQFDKYKKLVGLIPKLRVLKKERTLADAIIMEYFNFFNWSMNNVIHSPVAPGEFQMIRGDVFRQLGGYNEHIVALEDMDMFMRLGKIGKIKLERSICVYHTGRRAHKVGWARLIYLWTLNGFTVKFLHRSSSSEWKVIR